MPFKETDLSRRSPTLLIRQGNKICLLRGFIILNLFQSLIIMLKYAKYALGLNIVWFNIANPRHSAPQAAWYLPRNNTAHTRPQKLGKDRHSTDLSALVCLLPGKGHNTASYYWSLTICDTGDTDRYTRRCSRSQVWHNRQRRKKNSHLCRTAVNRLHSRRALGAQTQDTAHTVGAKYRAGRVITNLAWIQISMNRNTASTHGTEP